MDSYKVRYFAFITSGCVVLILFVIIKLDVQRDAFKRTWLPKIAAENDSTQSQTPKVKVAVLVYTTFFSQINWIKIEDRCGSDQRNKKQCSLYRFEITYDKSRFSESDMVVFHARNMPSIDVLNSLLNSRPSSQRWVYALWESPNATPNTTPLNGLFNLTWTYRTDSDFWGPYGRYERLSQEEIKRNEMAPVTDYTQGKSELVAWIVSNCGPQLRISFVHELKKYIKVDVFGGCSSTFGESRSCKGKSSDCIKNYKFYLSFENALCEDYITEKYWGNLGKPLLFLSVFVVFMQLMVKA